MNVRFLFLSAAVSFLSVPPPTPPSPLLLCPSPSFSSGEWWGGWAAGKGERGESEGGRGWLENGGRAAWNVGQSGGGRFHGNSVHSSQWHHQYGERRLGEEGEGGGGGNATEMHPDWLGLKHGSLRPLWSSATSWGEDKDGDVWNLPRLQNSLHRHEKPTHHTFTFCSVGPCGPTVSPGTPWGHLEATGSGTQRSPPSPCRPWPGPATGAEETCWRKSKTQSSNPPNVPALLGQTLILVWPPLAGMGSEPLRFHPERTRWREMMRWWDSVTVKYKLMIVFYRVNIQAHFKGIVCHFGKCSS